MEQVLAYLYKNGIEYPMSISICLGFNALLLYLLGLERKEKIRLVETYENEDTGKLAQQRKAHKEEIDRYEKYIAIERASANRAWEARTHDMEKVADAIQQLNTTTVILTERVRT